MTTVETRKNRIINVVYAALIIGAFYLFMKYCFWMFFPFLFAFFIAIIVQKPTNRILNKTKNRKGKGIISTIMVLLLLLIILAVLALLGAQIVNGIKHFYSFISATISDFPTFISNIKQWVLSVISVLPDSLEKTVSANISSWFESLEEKSASEAASSIVNSASDSGSFDISMLSSPISGIWSTVKHLPSVIVAVIITIVSSCFIAADYDRLVFFLKNLLNDKHAKALSTSKRILFTSLAQLIKAYALIICVTGTEMLIGLYILKLMGIFNSQYIVIIAIITALVDILPVLGTGTIMVPWALYSFITKDISLGIGLCVIYAVIYVVRQIIEPKLVATKLGLPPIITLMSLYIGAQLFGIIGMFLLPIVVIMVKLLNDEGVIHLWTPSSKKNVKDETSVKTSSDETHDS